MARKQAAAGVSFFAFQDIITSVVGIFVLITIIMMIELASRAVEGRASGQQVSEAQSAVLSNMQAEVARLRSRLDELKRIASSIGTSKPMTAEEKRTQIEEQLKDTQQRIERFEALQKQTSRALVAAETTLRQLKDDALESQKEEENRSLLGKLAHLRAEIDSLKDDDPLIFRNEKLQGKAIVIVDISAAEISVLELEAKRRQTFSGANRVDIARKWTDAQDLAATHFLLMLRPNGNSTFSTLRTHLQSKRASYGFDVIGEKRPLKMRSEIGTSGSVL